LLPAFPPDDVQLRFAGASGDDTMRDAFGVYTLVRRQAAAHLSAPPRTILEFGCGWGRIIRLFTRDVDPEALWGIDCLPSAIEFCQQSNHHARFQLVDPFPPTPIEAASFDLVYAYSVFSHLSEAAHLAWLAEFRRILKPGGLLVATTRPREFILMCADVRERHKDADWARGLAMSFVDTDDALARYDRGEFLFQPLGGGDVLDPSFFGETCIPRQYVAERWTLQFEFVDYVDDRSACLQNAIVVRKAR
jgi:SAM-dependent methyltransferase